MSLIIKRLFSFSLLFVAFFACCNGINANELTEESKELLEELKEQLQSTLLAVSELEKKEGNQPDSIYFAIDIPAQHLTNLGLVIDVESSDDGFSVMSVTPGSEAEKMGIIPGEKITKINHVVVNKSTSEQAINELNKVQVGKQISFKVKGENGEREVETEITGVFLPSIKLEIGGESEKMVSGLEPTSDSESSCGEISVFFSPPATRKLYPAYINGIDGKGVNRMKKTFRLKPGKYQVKVHELINSTLLTRRSRALQRAKTLEIEVKANVRYDLAAKFISEKKFSLRDEFWEPVIWREKEQQCEL